MTGKMPNMEHTSQEMMALIAAREIHNDDIVFCGTGISMVAAMAAKHISAPHSIIFFETGGIDCQLRELPLSVGDPRVMYGTTINAGLVESFAILQNARTGPKTVAILGAAQTDPYGNLNSTCLGDYRHPRMRFPGAGGASDAAAYAGRVITFMKQERRRFVTELDYFSSPGWPKNPEDRFRVGLTLPQDSLVITDKAVFRFDSRSRYMYLSGHYPGITPEAVAREVGFDLEIRHSRELTPPEPDEICLLREKIDPLGLIIKRKNA
jgi:glutaconate CoA-transferase subunit B